ncbi:unnamed protein product [Peronospora farinosa]|uniref:Uncharacterized protein n=1 Tax=Peronospora farinosa TaxID=134698 RepID=A0AAV0SRJ7_9STRA|nr:unnamed protein product [Peronospora farinosa]CAI5706573.1 unnamed protein product [Peronospora farinosa]
MTVLIAEALNVLTASSLPVPSVLTCDAYPSAKKFLQSRPAGVYTCVRAQLKVLNLEPVLSRVLVEWPFHVQRLTAGLVIMDIKFKHDKLKLKRLQMATEVVATNVMIQWQASETVDGMLSVLWYPLEESDDYGVAVHICAMPQPKCLASTVLVYGEGRENARCKHTQWIEDRVPLETHMAHLMETRGEPIHEVLLSKAAQGEDRFLLEGLVTNFFVVMDGQLYTAGQDVLQGSTRELVLKACRDLFIPVILEAPRLLDRESWQAAFVTSAVRVVIDVTRLLYEEKVSEHLVVRETLIPCDKTGLVQRIRDQISMQRMYLQ